MNIFADMQTCTQGSGPKFLPLQSSTATEPRSCRNVFVETHLRCLPLQTTSAAIHENTGKERSMTSGQDA